MIRFLPTRRHESHLATHEPSLSRLIVNVSEPSLHRLIRIYRPKPVFVGHSAIHHLDKLPIALVQDTHSALLSTQVRDDPVMSFAFFSNLNSYSVTK